MVVEQPSDRDGGPNVRQVIRSPNKTTDQEDRGVEVLENLPLLAEEVERNRDEGANRETPQETIVDGTSTEHLLGSKGTPEDGGGEECVNAGTGEVVLLLRCANIGDLRHLVVEDSRADKSGNECGKHLAVEGDPRWNMDVMGELEVLGKVEGVRGGNVSVGLEVVHGGGVTWEPETTEQLGNNVEGDFYVGNGHDDAARNTEDDGEEDTVQHNGGGGVGGVSGNTSSTNTDGDTQHEEVGPLWNLFV